MNRLEKVIASAVMLTYLSGCASSTNTIRRHERDEVKYDPAPITYSNITIPKPKENIIADASNMVAYLDFLDYYQPKSDEIIKNLKNGKRDEVQREIRNLVNILEDDDSIFADQQIDFLKNFNYTVFEINEIYQKKTKRESRFKDPFEFALFLVYLPFLVAMEIPKLIVQTEISIFSNKAEITPGELPMTWIDSKLPKISHEQLVRSTFNKIRITPYSGKREILLRNVPYNKINEYHNK